MPSLETLLLFTAAAALMNISPGPSNLYVFSRGLAQGPRAGLVAAGGLATGGMVHVVAAALGVSALLQLSATAFTVLKLVGAAYLVWLGLRYLLTPGAGPLEARSVAATPYPRIFRESVLVEVLNPKTALFFLAFLPQFVALDAGPVAPQIVLLGLIVTATALPCDALVAVASGRVAKALERRPFVERLRNRLSGAILVGLGVFVALAKRA
ncbi:MAG: LysE family translocator [Alphaproteobacteria bacterium]